MKERYIEIVFLGTGKREVFDKCVDIYRKYDKEALGITYNAMMNVLSKEGKYSNDKISVSYRKRLNSVWK